MKIYLAARYSRYPEMQERARELTAIGHVVTSVWIRGEHTAEGDANAAHDLKRQFAEDDIRDVMYADCVISFTEPPSEVVGRGRGGRHVEFGIGLALGRRSIVVGHRENVFHSLPDVEFFETWDEALAHLADEQERRRA